MMITNCKTNPNWLKQTLESVKYVGYMIVEGVLEPDFIEQTKAAIYRAKEHIIQEVGTDRLERAGELGVLRLMLKFDPLFFRLLEIPEVLAVVDNTVSNTAILHLQNGLVLPSHEITQQADVFQTRFHMDFARVLNGYLMSINTFFAIDGFTKENGGTLVVPGTHQQSTRPEAAYLDEFAVSVECAPGSMIVFDSTLWHAGGQNLSGKDRIGINQQFTRSYVKQQIDYVRALGEAVVLQQPARTQQLLGYYTRLVTSLDEYYQPAEKRLYRGGQG